MAGSFRPGPGGDSPRDRDVARIFAECLDLWRAGDERGLEKLIEAHPEIAEELRESLEVLRAVGPGLATGLDGNGDGGEQPPEGEDGETGQPAAVRRPRETARVLRGRIGSFQIREKIGEGGFAEVFLAEQLDPFRRVVALKILKAGMDTRRIVARFEAERQTLALLDHPNVARILDGGSTREGRPYFVLEYVRGPRITEYCDRHALGVRHRLELFQQVCDAVQQAHQKGIIHRDIKASNVLVTDEANRPLVKVIDFGIAKAINGPLVETTGLTESGQMVGTPSYMSPEQATGGRSIDIDTRADVYSLGVLLYELLAGVLPFDPVELSKMTPAQIQRTIAEVEAPRPSVRFREIGAAAREIAADRGTDPRGLCRQLQGDLDWITMKCLEKDRTRRYPTASELRADISRYLNHEPVRAERPRLCYRLGKFARRHRRPVAAAAAVIFVLAAGFGVSLALYLRAERLRGEADRARAGEAEERKALAQALDAERRQRESKEQALRAQAKALAEKERALVQAEAAYLTARSAALLPEDPGLALLLAIEAQERAPGVVANTAVINALVALKERRTLLGHERRVYDASFSPDAEWLVTGSEDRTVRVWHAKTGAQILVFSGHEGPVYSVVFHPGGKQVLSASEDGTVRLWDVASGRPVLTFRRQGFPYSIRSASFSPDGTRVASGFENGQVEIREAARGTVLLDLACHSRSVRCLRFSPGGDRLITGSMDRTARIWDLQSDQCLLTLAGGGGMVLAVGFSPDGRKVAIAGEDVASIHDASSGARLAVLEGHSATVYSIAFSPGGDRVATSSGDGTVRIWDATSGAPLGVLRGHGGLIRSVRYSADGRWIATAAEVRTARIWEAEGRDQIVSLEGHTSSVFSVAFSPDGKRVATASRDHTARIWPLDALAVAKLRKPRELTLGEVAVYRVREEAQRAAYAWQWEIERLERRLESIGRFLEKAAVPSPALHEALLEALARIEELTALEQDRPGKEEEAAAVARAAGVLDGALRAIDRAGGRDSRLLERAQELRGVAPPETGRTATSASQ